MVLEERFQRLSQHRREHIMRVMEVMEALARAHHLSVTDAKMAGYGHDLAREMSRTELLQEGHRLSLTWGPPEEQEPVLLHGPVAAAWVKAAGVGDPSIWNAICFHTTAAEGLDALGKALYIADAVEPGRQYPERASLCALSLQNLDAGYCAVLEHTRTYLTQRGLTPHPQMLAAIQECHSDRKTPQDTNVLGEETL